MMSEEELKNIEADVLRVLGLDVPRLVMAVRDFKRLAADLKDVRTGSATWAVSAIIVAENALEYVARHGSVDVSLHASRALAEIRELRERASD